MELEIETFLDWKNKEPSAGTIISTLVYTDGITNGTSPVGGTGPSTPRPTPTSTVNSTPGKGSYNGDGTWHGG